MRRGFRGLGWALLAVGLTACGPLHGSGSVSGDPYGFDVHDAFLVRRSGSSPDLSLVQVMLLPHPWSCDELKANIAQLGPPFAKLQVDGVANPVLPGDYPINANVGSGPLVGLEVTVAAGDTFEARTGTITVETASADSASGAFHVSNGPTSLSGDFDAPACDALP